MAKSRGYRVLQARPAESELRLSFAAIADLVGGAFEETRAKLPLPQERALATALLHVDTEEPAEPRTTATALVSILTMLAAERPVLPDGSELGLRSHLLEVDPLNQHLVYEMRAERWRDGVLEEAETHRLDHALYFRNELLLMFERAGFADVRVHGEHEEREPTADDDFLVFVARKT